VQRWIVSPLIVPHTHRAERIYDTVSIVLVGKYITLQDSYMSVVKALEHASMRCGRKLNLEVSEVVE
jgi:CTP synthase